MLTHNLNSAIASQARQRLCYSNWPRSISKIANVSLLSPIRSTKKSTQPQSANFLLTFSLLFYTGERSRRNPVPNLTVKRSFTARNTGELPIDIHGFYISGLLCEGYGFKVLNCGPFKLNPNATKKIEIAFTPDFTLSRIERELLILTSLGAESTDAENGNENGMVRLSLLTTVPSHTLESCATVLIRPNWERAVQCAAISLSCILLMCILAVSFLEADRILRGALATLSRTSPVQPPLDLRQLTQTLPVTKDKQTPSEDKSKSSRKDETLPDWSLMNVKRSKDVEALRSLKIPDWSAEEERRFKLDTELKEVPVFQKSKVEETPPMAETGTVMNDSSVSTINSARKKNTKRQNSVPDVTVESICPVVENSIAEMQVLSEKRFVASSSTKSSPIASRKGKSNNGSTASPKDQSKTVDTELQLDSACVNNARDAKTDAKRKQTNGSTASHNNHSSYKKYETSTSQKAVQFSEEETSSTTTESSVHDDPAPYKVGL